MMYQQDWLLRQVQIMVKMIYKLIFNKESVTNDIIDDLSCKESGELHYKLNSLLSDNNINEAENLLFDSVVSDNLDYLKIAISFYSQVNQMSDDQLEKADFSREEIKKGLEDIMKIFGIDL